MGLYDSEFLNHLGVSLGMPGVCEKRGMAWDSLRQIPMIRGDPTDSWIPWV